MRTDPSGQLHPEEHDIITPAGLVHVAVCGFCLEHFSGKDDLVLAQIRDMIQTRERAAHARGSLEGYRQAMKAHWDAVGQVVTMRTRVRRLERKLTARSAALGRARTDLRTALTLYGKLDQRNMELEDKRKD